jgi:hypothetical protein
MPTIRRRRRAKKGGGMQVRNSIGGAAVLLILAGCTAVPVVEYSEIKVGPPPEGVTDTFYRAQSRITLNKTETESEKTKKKTTQFSITSAPVAYDADYKIGVKPKDSLTVTTKINVTKIENTDLVRTIGVETTDNTVNFINQVGGVLVKAVTLFAKAPPSGAKPAPEPEVCIADDEFPIHIQIDSAELASGAGAKLPVPGRPCLEVIVGPAPKDAVKTVESDMFKKPTSNFFYSACREATVTYYLDKDRKKKFAKIVRIADPTHLQAVQFPYKGSVTMHSECGVSVTTESTSPQNSIAIIDAVAGQLKAFKDAIDAAK